MKMDWRLLSWIMVIEFAPGVFLIAYWCAGVFGCGGLRGMLLPAGGGGCDAKRFVYGFNHQGFPTNNEYCLGGRLCTRIALILYWIYLSRFFLVWCMA